MNQPATKAQVTPAMDSPSHVTHAKLLAWVAETALLTKPERIVWCDD